MSPRPRFLLTFLGWSGGLSGGDRHLLEVAASWREHVDIGVLAPAGAGSTIQSFLGEVRVHTLGQRRATAGPMLAAEYVKRSALILLRERSITADYVVAGSHFTADTAALVSLVRRGATGVSYVYHLVAERSGLAPRTVWSKLDERVGLALLRRFATVVFTSNSNTARTLAEYGFDPVRTAVGVDLASFPRVDPGALPPQGAFVARMARSKGVHDAVEAWARVRAEVHDARLVMIGAGPERSKGMALAERLGIAEAIQWPGFVSDDEKRRVLARSRVLLAPSYEEGWGISVCEALACGVPVVAYRHPVLHELFGDAYVGVTAGDVPDLAERTVRVLQDDTLARELSEGGREVAQRYDVTRVAEQELEAILSAPCAS